MKPNTARRQPKTVRGSDVVNKVLETAATLLQDDWLDNVSIAKLARESGISRASLLLQFQNGWPDIAYGLLCREFDSDYSELTWKLVEEPLERTVNDRMFELLDYLLTRAERTGLMYANLRAQMFIWGDENTAMMEVQLSDVLECMVRMFDEVTKKPDAVVSSRATDMLFNSTIDLAALRDIPATSFDQRRAAVRTMIDLTVAGVRQHA